LEQIEAGVLNQPDQRRGVLAWIGRQSAYLSSIYYTLGVVAFVVAALTFIVNYANRSDKSGISKPVEPFGPYLPNWLYTALLEYRWPIAGVFVVVLVGVAVLHRRMLVRRLTSLGLIDEILLQHAGILTEIRTFPPNGDMRALAGAVDHFLIHTLNRIAVLFSRYTGHPAHVS
jgi:uncharacterized membrane protein YhhN